MSANANEPALVLDERALNIMAELSLYILLPADMEYVEAQQVRVLASLLEYMNQVGVRPNFTLDVLGQPKEGKQTNGLKTKKRRS